MYKLSSYQGYSKIVAFKYLLFTVFVLFKRFEKRFAEHVWAKVHSPFQHKELTEKILLT